MALDIETLMQLILFVIAMGAFYLGLLSKDE